MTIEKANIFTWPRSTASSGRGSPRVARGQGQELVARGDGVVGAVQHPRAHEVRDEGHELLVAPRAAQAVEGEGPGLVLVVGEHQLRHLVGHLLEDAVALGACP